MPGLGRIVSEDERDLAYPMRAVLATAPARVHHHWWMHGAWLDQGDTGTCVGHAWAHYVEDSPYTHKGTIDPYGIYRDATLIDEWTGNDNGDLNFGTSVRAGAQALLDRGAITEYRWAWDVATVMEAILTTGPVVVGTNWYTGMFDIDSKGVLKVEGAVAGGHAYVLNGVNQNYDRIRMKNSWGRNWGWGTPGKQGYAWISIPDMDRLIRENGEACLAVESKSWILP